MIRQLFKGMLLSASLVLFSGSLAGFAATVNVTVGFNSALRFSPTNININVGDRVLWTWAGPNHNVTSTTSAWTASPTQSSGTFTNTFNSAGTFPYECTIHVSSGMTGSVVVAAANLPPTVAITNPVSDAVFAAPANVTIRASASDSDGTVTNVHFLIGSTNLGNVTVPPYSAVAGSLSPGSYTLSAVASDNNGATATNSVSISVVNPVTVSLSAPQPVSPAKFRFSYTANAGLNYIVQSSTNLLSPNWITLVTNTAASGSITFTDLNATFNPGFYRVGRLPNP